MSTSLNRRTTLKLLGLAAVGHLATATRARGTEVPFEPGSAELERCDWLPGLDLTEPERELMLRGMRELAGDWDRARAVPLDNAVAPAVRFDATPGDAARSELPRRDARPGPSPRRRPDSDGELDFASLRRLAALVKAREVSSVELTRRALERLARLDPLLHFVISRTEERAMDRARRADAELAAGRWRGPLHGIPWGAKDLFAVPGAPTTWGARPYREQVRDETATVVGRLDDAGAALVAKLTLGALAWGDVWFGGMTRNPWKPSQGASGSSAGSASAVAAGAVPFALGTETYGSIVSPCTRCGATGLRPTFGRVSRHGAMALSWTMDKVGPIARTVEDCALVFDAIHGADGLDPTAVDRPFRWPLAGDPRSLRVGYVAELFDGDPAEGVDDAALAEALREQRRFDQAVLDVLRALGVRLVPVTLPGDLPVDALGSILFAEAACAFDELTRSGRDEELVRQEDWAWPNFFRLGQMVGAVEYLRANRIRALVMERMKEVFREVDVYVAPSFGGDNLLRTNLTGHPQVVAPNGFRASDGTPTSITFTGRPFGETELLAVAQLWQEATDFHRKHPPLG